MEILLTIVVGLLALLLLWVLITLIAKVYRGFGFFFGTAWFIVLCLFPIGTVIALIFMGVIVNKGKDMENENNKN